MIKYFVAHGGKFTPCTGRRGEGFYFGKERDFEINALIIGLIGAQIYDGPAGKVVEQYCMEDNWTEIVENIINCIGYELVIEFVGIDEVIRFCRVKKIFCRVKNIKLKQKKYGNRKKVVIYFLYN